MTPQSLLELLSKDVFPSKDGFSIVSVNSIKGQEIIKGIAKDYYTWRIDYNYSQTNLIKPTHRPRERDKVYKMSFSPDRIDGNTGINIRISLSDRVKNIFPQKFKDRIKRIINW